MPAALVLDHPTRHRLRSDDELVAALRRGSDLAFAELVQRHGPALARQARAILGGAHHDAEEAVQDALMRALGALRRSPERPVVLVPWLRTIVRNACLDRLRRPSRTVELERLAPVLGDRGADPADVLARREELGALVGSLQRLPARQRRALVGLELEGRSHEELARELEVTVPASKALVSRARAGLGAARATGAAA